MRRVEHSIHISQARSSPVAQVSHKIVLIIKHVPKSSHARYVPAVNGAVEGIRIPKHSLHVPNARSVPSVQILIEIVRIVEHIINVRNRRHIPRSNGLIELLRVVEHVLHICNGGNVPRANILVKRIRVVKHTFHIRDFRYVPVWNLRIRMRRVEYCIQTRKARGIPVTQILSECVCTLKHMTHVRYRWDVPGGDISVKIWIPLKQSFHVCHFTHVPIWHGAVFAQVTQPIDKMRTCIWIETNPDGVLDIFVRDWGQNRGRRRRRRGNRTVIFTLTPHRWSLIYVRTRILRLERSSSTEHFALIVCDGASRPIR